MSDIALPICKENAAQYGRMGLLARKQKKDEIDRILHAVKTDYVAGELVNVRSQITRLSGMLDTETDPLSIYRLTASLDKLRDTERKLAGRPDPGSYRPVKERKPKTGESAGPIDE